MKRELLLRGAVGAGLVFLLLLLLKAPFLSAGFWILVTLGSVRETLALGTTYEQSLSIWSSPAGRPSVRLSFTPLLLFWLSLDLGRRIRLSRRIEVGPASLPRGSPREDLGGFWGDLPVLRSWASRAGFPLLGLPRGDLGADPVTSPSRRQRAAGVKDASRLLGRTAASSTASTPSLRRPRRLGGLGR